MQKNWIYSLRIYSMILVLLGMIGYSWNPEKAVTSLILASGVGLVLYFISFLPKSLMRSCKAAITICVCLLMYGAAVGIRAIFAWIAWTHGMGDKLFPAILLSTVSLLTFVTLSIIFRSRKCSRKEQ